MVVQRVAAGLLVLAVVDGFRVTSRRQNSSVKEPDIVADDDEGSIEALERAVRAIIGDLPDTRADLSLFHKCNLSQSECSIRDMDRTNLVYTGHPDSKCFSGEPFAFLVRPGRLDKLLYYFPNGGACWQNPIGLPDQHPIRDGICIPNLALGLGVSGMGMGFTNSLWPGNKLADFTVVAPAYCDGTGHVGNTTWDGTPGGRPQRGYLNNRLTMDWAKKNLDQTLENFVMAGSSAGAIGTAVWSHWLLNYFQYKKATVIVDSYMAVFPEGSQGPTISNFRVCDLPIWEHFRAECEANTSNVQDMFDYAIAAHPDVAFATIEDKADGVQRLFWGLIRRAFNKPREYMASYKFYKETNSMLERYNKHPNHVHYYVEKLFHTHLWYPLYHTTTVTSATGFFGDKGRPKLEQWVNRLIEHEPVLSQCWGDLEQNGGDSSVFKNCDYCDKELHPKALFNRYCFEGNYDYRDKNIPFINPKTASSAEDCQDQCSRTRLCQYFTFETQKSSRNCWLKYSKSGRRPQTGLTSGGRSCELE